MSACTLAFNFCVSFTKRVFVFFFEIFYFWKCLLRFLSLLRCYVLLSRALPRNRKNLTNNKPDYLRRENGSQENIRDISSRDLVSSHFVCLFFCQFFWKRRQTRWRLWGKNLIRKCIFIRFHIFKFHFQSIFFFRLHCFATTMSF